MKYQTPVKSHHRRNGRNGSGYEIMKILLLRMRNAVLSRIPDRRIDSFRNSKSWNLFLVGNLVKHNMIRCIFAAVELSCTDQLLSHCRIVIGLYIKNME